MKEILHRTKNNMSAIISLLRLQKRRFEDQEVVRRFQETENRVHSMLLVQEKLYQSTDLTHLDLKPYLHDLAQTIFSNLGIETGKVSLIYDLEAVTVSPDAAIPCGLILNELLTNAFKYAFPGDRKGEITIALQ